MAAKKQKKDWVIMTSGDRSLDDVAKELKKSGFKVDHVMNEIGMITGSADDAAAAKARKLKGVTDVSANAGADVGPPNSSDTW
jgi:hypothetical protein